MSNRNSKNNQELYANFPHLFPELAPARSYSKNNQNTSLREETLCPCPPETAKPALVAVDGGILDIVKQLKEIQENINLINSTAFNNSTLTDAQHYQLLDVEMFIEDFIAPYSYREVIQ